MVISKPTPKDLRRCDLLEFFPTLSFLEFFILGSSYIDKALLLLIKGRLAAESFSSNDKPFYEKRSFGLADKAQLCSSLELITKDEYELIHCFNKIRNDFAHEIEVNPDSFKDRMNTLADIIGYEEMKMALENFSCARLRDDSSSAELVFEKRDALNNSISCLIANLEHPD